MKRNGLSLLGGIGFLGAAALLGCASSSQTGEPPRQAVLRLVKMHQEDRARFVRNLQEMERGGDCGRVEQLRREAERMDLDGSAGKENQRDLVVVKMELAEAEKRCRD